jgi:hypothetical protein
VLGRRVRTIARKRARASLLIATRMNVKYAQQQLGHTLAEGEVPVSEFSCTS